jgi:hypothetical protein
VTSRSQEDSSPPHGSHGSGGTSPTVRRAALAFLGVFFGIPLGFAGLLVFGAVPAWVFWAVVQIYVIAVMGACVFALVLIAPTWAREPWG